jgi:hypothetical protein
MKFLVFCTVFVFGIVGLIAGAADKPIIESSKPVATAGQLVLVTFPGDDQILTDTAKRRAELYEALNTRPMTSKEIVEVAKFGPLLNRNPGESFNLNQKDLEIQNSLLCQILLTMKAAAK